jgi:DNA helicase II / ATP-dependent DNA helicase PcrA
MSFIADLHIHSHFSRATSSACRLEHIAAWAVIKGIKLIGTGDFTHPEWLAEIREALEPAEPGVFKLSRPAKMKLSGNIQADTADTRFILSVEISSIYKKNGKTRKIHNIIFAPDLKSAEKISARLARIGNIRSDGRPILGLDARNLLEIVLESSPDACMIPAHIWTPWFSLFGSQSGFDAIEECFEDLTPNIFALETGLSSDPPMNRLLSSLDRYALVSNSDAHSPEKLGREANIFSCSPDYFSLFNALKTKKGFTGTVEFYPEEGKYHLDGHRKCGVSLTPGETRSCGGLCPVCKKPVTVGVLNRVSLLADRKIPVMPKVAGDFFSVIPLAEVIAETVGTGSKSKKVAGEYARLLHAYGSEFEILLNTPVEVLEKDKNPLIGEAIRRMRSGRVIRHAGYDGEFGVIRIFDEDERKQLSGRHIFSKAEKKTPSGLKREKLIFPESTCS